jgi:antibiotic biosynthesis monooxygenase (ABM) superfamily enzyme
MVAPADYGVVQHAGSAKGEQMIARIWRGWAPPGAADDYQHHFEAEVSDHLQAVSGFCGARLLRREDGQEVMFTSITYFTGLDAVRAFAGASYEQAVVEQTARQVLSRWDERVSHHEVAVDLQLQPPEPPRSRTADTTSPSSA